MEVVTVPRRARGHGCVIEMSPNCINSILRPIIQSGMDNSDIRNTAQLMIDEFGAEAEHQAFKRANQALLEGNTEGEQIWRQVVALILELKSGAK